MSKKGVKYHFLKLVNMSDDIDHEGTSAAIRSGIRFQGANVFILACAIVIASVGLNVNSIPVIIGAMLISPVMGPILGFGFGLAVQDDQLVKSSLKNYLIMVAISIGASFLYFLLTPLQLENPTELLARTNPTLYDVLIALFGGFAGILEQSRKQKGTVISGVAIATALMPPLCTVGYGLSLFKAQYVLGALYLFLINSVFIALATFLMVKYLKYPVVAESDGHRRLSKRSVTIMLLVVIIPSIYSAVQIVRESNFNRHVQQLVAENRNVGRAFVYDHKTHYTSKHATVELYIVGPAPTEQEMEAFYHSADELGLKRDQIVVNSNGMSSLMGMVETDLVKDIFKTSEERQSVLQDSLRRLSDSLAAFRSLDGLYDAVAHEIMVQYPKVGRVLLGHSRMLASGNGARPESQLVVLLETGDPLPQSDMEKLKAWLRVRVGEEKVHIVQSVVSGK